MGAHLRIFANLGAWRPCLFAHDINPAEAAWLSSNSQLVNFFLSGILKGAISMETTSAGASTPSTLANTHTENANKASSPS